MSFPNPFEFTGKTGVLACATGGLGHPISVAFANLALCARSEPAVARLAAEPKGSKGGLMTSSVDVCEEKEVVRFTEAVKAKFATIDVLVTLVGGIIRKPSVDYSLAEWQQVKRVAQILKRMPLGKLLPADALVGPMMFLASDAARRINGHTINVDTGSNIT